MRTDPSASFEAHRRRLLGLAYRMLGSIAEAEDAVQEAYVRWHAADRKNVAAFLAGVVRKGWTEDMTVRLDTINGLPGLVVSGRQGLVQTTAFEIEGDVVKAIYIVRNPDKLKHVASS